jgi:hypothetical protein
MLLATLLRCAIRSGMGRLFPYDVRFLGSCPDAFQTRQQGQARIAILSEKPTLIV